MTSKTITIQDGPRMVRLNRAMWFRVHDYMRSKTALWDLFLPLVDADPAWDNYNRLRNEINDRYRDIFGTPEYKLALMNEVSESLNAMAGISTEVSR